MAKSTFSGVFTPTEAAAVGAILALFITLVLRQLTWRILLDCLESTVTMTSMVLIVVVGASIIASFLALVGFPRTVAEFVVGTDSPAWLILTLIFLLYLFLGCA